MTNPYLPDYSGDSDWIRYVQESGKNQFEWDIPGAMVRGAAKGAALGYLLSVLLERRREVRRLRSTPGSQPPPGMAWSRPEPRLDRSQPASIAIYIRWMVGESVTPDLLRQSADVIGSWRGNPFMAEHLPALTWMWRKKVAEVAQANPHWASEIDALCLELERAVSAPSGLPASGAAQSDDGLDALTERGRELIRAISGCTEPDFLNFQEIDAEFQAFTSEAAAFASVLVGTGTTDLPRLRYAEEIFRSVQAAGRELLARVERHNARVLAQRAQAAARPQNPSVPGYPHAPP